MQAIERLSGEKINLPQGKELVMRDQTDENTIYINIPPKQKNDMELSEEQLEAVAGASKLLSSEKRGNYWQQ